MLVIIYFTFLLNRISSSHLHADVAGRGSAMRGFKSNWRWHLSKDHEIGYIEMDIMKNHPLIEIFIIWYFVLYHLQWCKSKQQGSDMNMPTGGPALS